MLNVHIRCPAFGPRLSISARYGVDDIQGGRADLTISFAEIVSKVKPQYFIMENVNDIKKYNILKTAKEIFIKNNYGLKVKKYFE